MRQNLSVSDSDVICTDC